MRAIETTGTVNEQGQLCLDQPLDVAEPQRVRVIVLLAEYEAELENEEGFSATSFRQSWEQAMTGQTLPLSQLWEDSDVG
ncbi:type II toxin-antitoxin system RelN family antitoxin [Pantanalinema sp. GBBB05]|uniref:type II toxin-antitoxin system RelN family antitoxin n=1 Tax=Pantanalinema sp. GBBB05 TaxID=2604139 RepID=UPI001DE5AE71|nr:hypothetical protein [Pantanalinema sp. GBBB05]